MKYQALYTSFERMWTVDVSADTEVEAHQKAHSIVKETWPEIAASLGTSLRNAYMDVTVTELDDGNSLHVPLIAKWEDGRTWASGGYNYSF